ncbi:MAG: intermembrane transport protein PqiB [Pseudomonadales bacterium]
MSDTQSLDVEVSSRRRIPAIWFLPIIAALLGLWMLYYNISNQGPVITIQFETAEGIQAGKTKIKSRNVDLGVVDAVTLSPDRVSVVVTAQLEPTARELVNDTTQFWVVRARVDSGGVSGLGTVLSGGYIELAPGDSSTRRRDFVGLEAPPITAVGTPGIHVFLASEQAGSVGTGDPVLYRGFNVGRVESEEFDMDAQLMRFRLFVRAPFDGLLRTTTRFWNRSGIDISATAQGFSVSTGSLQTLVTGGVEFSTDERYGPGDPATEGTAYTLFPNYKQAQEDPFDASAAYVVLFTQSLSGLNPGAPVKLRGIQVGRVERIMMEEISLQGLAGEQRAVPVLIKVEPGRMRWSDDESGVARAKEAIAAAVADKLYATLQTGSLLTGQLMVALDFYPAEPAASMGEFAGYSTIPTKSTGLAQIEQKVVAVLDRIQSMPLGEIGESTKSALDELTATLASTRKTVAEIETLMSSEGTQQLPGELTASLEQLRETLGAFSQESSLYDQLNSTVLELQRTLNSVEGLARSLQDQPNSLIFPVRRKADPIPGEDR